jgi:hypothetical protein
LPHEFVEHVIREQAKYETIEQDDGWWLEAVRSQ